MTTTTNGHGGKRAGAGRPPAPPIFTSSATTTDPLEFLTSIMVDGAVDAKLRLEAAKALMPFIHQKLGDAGKKDTAKDAAKKAAVGRYAPSAPPGLRAVK